MYDKENIPIDELAKAIYTINRHAKTAPKPRHLYFIKKEAIDQLLREKRAEKIGLHFSNHPRLSNQYSTVLVKVGNYYFHIPPTKDDFRKMKHLGSLDYDYRNPQSKMPLSHAKQIIYQYINWKPQKKQSTRRKPYSSAYFTASSLGKIKRSPRNRLTNKNISLHKF
ncbi:MAG TPA: YkyB family protein [Bacillota bacterium]|nr:YkyB family protein [Bacillota bacterium]